MLYFKISRFVTMAFEKYLKEKLFLKTLILFKKLVFAFEVIAYVVYYI